MFNNTFHHLTLMPAPNALLFCDAELPGKPRQIHARRICWYLIGICITLASHGYYIGPRHPQTPVFHDAIQKSMREGSKKCVALPFPHGKPMGQC